MTDNPCLVHGQNLPESTLNNCCHEVLSLIILNTVSDTWTTLSVTSVTDTDTLLEIVVAGILNAS